MELHTLTNEDIAKNGNIFKEILLRHLLENGHISEEVSQDYLKNYAFIVAKRSFFNKFWDQFVTKEQADNPNIILVKQVSMKETNVERYAEDKKNGNQKKK